MNQKSIQTARLDIAYLEAGEPGAPPVLLLHGFPDDATAWNRVGASLAESGHRVIAPFVRGCGPTRFLRPETPRAGDFAALGQDALDLVDALDLSDLIVVGQDWGSPTAEIVAALRPERVRRLVKLNWYGVYSMTEQARAGRFVYPQLHALWYVWLLNTPMGEMVLQADRNGFASSLWSLWSPSWDAGARQASLDSVLPSLAGDDWMRVALAAYRDNITDNERDRADDDLRARLAQSPPVVRCPTRIVHGADDGVEGSPLDGDALARWFVGGATVESLAGVGHWPQRESPADVVRAVLA